MECGLQPSSETTESEDPGTSSLTTSCMLGATLRPRLAARGSLELYAVGGAAWRGVHGTTRTAADGDPEPVSSSERLAVTGGISVQKWLTPELTLSTDLGVGSLVWLSETDESGEETVTDASLTAVLAPSVRLMLHLYW